VVSAARVEQLTTVFYKTRGRLPTRSELDLLLDDWVREELAYREGRNMGLDRDDTMVRRRIRQKLEFFVEGLTDQAEPTEQDLADYLAQHAGDFREEPALDFRQVYLNPERGEQLDADAAELLERLRAGEVDDLHALGDRLMIDSEFRDTPLREVRALFGIAFAQALSEQQLGRWLGPIPSGYGAHLVIVDHKVDGRMPELAEIRDEVRREWHNAARERALADFYEAMAQRYEVEIEWPATSSDDGEDETP
jgi:PPIC-type PPIASE domain